VVALSCAALLLVGHPARAARGDAGARRVVRAQATVVRTQFGRAESCFAQRSATCVANSTFALYADALDARTKVGTLLTHSLSTTIRTGVERYVAALDIQVRLSFQLYQAGLSRYIPRIDQAHAGDAELLGKMLLAAPGIAAKLGVADGGFRLVINNGRDAGESVPHLHIHLLGGRALQWPPG